MSQAAPETRVGGRPRPGEATPVERSDGFLPVGGFRLYYEQFVPDRPRATVLALHGGPGGSHTYLSPIAGLTAYGYRIVFFDQLGCGRSDRPSDTSLFTLEHNVEEVEGIRRGLRLGRVHLLGSSYGGLLALAYALRYQRHLRSLVTVGGLASVPLCSSEMQRLKSLLPDPVRRTLERYERREEYQHPRY
jgi:proline iminopeptidase